MNADSINDINNEMLIESNGAQYLMIHSDTEILVNAENEYSQDGCTAEKLVDILNQERYSLHRYFSKEAQPKIQIEKEILINGEPYITTPVVSQIGTNAFRGNMAIEKVVVPYGVAEIEEGAFAFCGRLQEVELPETLEVVHPDAFAYSAIIHFIIPNGMTDMFKTLMPLYSNRLIEKGKYISLDVCDPSNIPPKAPLLYEVYNDGKTGFIDESGDIVISASFVTIVGAFSDKKSKIIANNGRAWFIIDIKGNMTVLNLEGKGKPVSLHNSEYLKLEKGWNQQALYNIFFNSFTFDYGVFDYIGNYNVRWRVFRVKKGDKWGVVRADGKMILPVNYPKVTMGEDSCAYIDEEGNKKKLYYINHPVFQPDSGQYYGDKNYERDTWDAMTDGMYGDYCGGDDFDIIGE